MAERLSFIKKIISEYIQILANKGVSVERVILFGSYAKGHERKDSDIDIIIIAKDLEKFNFPERLSFLSQATLSINAPLEVIGYTPDEVKDKNGKSIFWDEISATGKEIYKIAA